MRIPGGTLARAKTEGERWTLDIPEIGKHSPQAGQMRLLPQTNVIL